MELIKASNYGIKLSPYVNCVLYFENGKPPFTKLTKTVWLFAYYIRILWAPADATSNRALDVLLPLDLGKTCSDQVDVMVFRRCEGSCRINFYPNRRLYKARNTCSVFELERDLQFCSISYHFVVFDLQIHLDHFRNSQVA